VPGQIGIDLAGSMGNFQGATVTHIDHRVVALTHFPAVDAI
jgi:hypothetical protein